MWWWTSSGEAPSSSLAFRVVVADLAYVDCDGTKENGVMQRGFWESHAQLFHHFFQEHTTTRTCEHEKLAASLRAKGMTSRSQ